MSLDLRAPFARNFGQLPVAETFAAFLRMLQDLQEMYGDDYEAIAIAALVHKVTFSDCVECAVGQGSPRFATQDARPSISRLNVAEVLGIPRETVRRKANELIALGVIEEVEHAQLVTARHHRQAAQELSASMARRIAIANPRKQERG